MELQEVGGQKVHYIKPYKDYNNFYINFFNCVIQY